MNATTKQARRGGRPAKDPEDRLVRATGYVTQSDRDAFLALAAREGVSEGQWIARAILERLAKLRKKA